MRGERKTNPLSTDHIAVVVLCHQDDTASLRTVYECTENFASQQIYVVDYHQKEQESMVRPSLEVSGLLHRVNYVYVGDDKHTALKHVCASTLAHFTHILIVDAQVGARHALLHDGLSRSIGISTCIYFGKTATASWLTGEPPSTTTPRDMVRSLSLVPRRTPSPPRKSLSCSSLARKSMSSISVTLHHPTFVNETNPGMPNHFLDLWDRTTLYLYLVGSHVASPCESLGMSFRSTPCSLQKAISRSYRGPSRSNSVEDLHSVAVKE